MLTDRRRDSLKLIVDDYINGAMPVSSDTIARKMAFPVSSATVRNEMSALEDEGYLAQPHTSAGRVPSDIGYRYFVEFLMPEQQLSADEQRMIDHQFYQVQLDTDQWVRLAAEMREVETPTPEQIVRDGLLNIMAQPEFAQTERVRQFMSIFESGRLLEGALTEALTSDGVRVIIGSENKSDDMRQCSMVLSRY